MHQYGVGPLAPISDRGGGARLFLAHYLIEGVTCAGKTSACKELKNRGYTAIDGDNELAYQGDPKTGAPTDGYFHEYHIWDVKKVESLLNNKEEAIFFCGGSRNLEQFIDRSDEVFVLDIDYKTLEKRLDTRKKGEWGSSKEQRMLALQLHETK